MENQSDSKFIEIAKKLDSNVLSVIGSDKIQGFQKAYLVADAISQLSELLTPEYMQPIMALQGNRLGFKTDKDLVKQQGGGYSKGPGYPEPVVKNCLIEAVLMGLQPVNNQFNIIGGNMYPTKEGCGYLLNNFKGLSYNLVCSLPRINPNNTSAAVDVKISWILNGETKEETIPIPIKMDSYTSVDAIIGKATRKGRAWLLSRISGMEITDGDIQDVGFIEVKQPQTIVELDASEIEQKLKVASTKEEVNILWKQLSENQQSDFEIMFNEKEKEL